MLVKALEPANKMHDAPAWRKKVGWHGGSSRRSMPASPSATTSLRTAHYRGSARRIGPRAARGNHVHAWPNMSKREDRLPALVSVVDDHDRSRRLRVTKEAPKPVCRVMFWRSRDYQRGTRRGLRDATSSPDSPS